MSAARIHLIWGTVDFHKTSLDRLQAAMKKSQRLCATIVDTLGREVIVRRPYQVDERGWGKHEKAIEIKAGQKITLTCKPGAIATDNCLPVTYSKFASMTEKGDTIYVGRYLVCGADSASLYFNVLAVEGDEVLCEATNDGVLDGLTTVFHMERSTEMLQNMQNDLPLLSEVDKEYLTELAKGYEIDFLCLSFCRTGEDILEARAFLDAMGLTNTKLIAKVETRQSLMNFRSIIAEADGVIMSRGNLGLDVVPEKMALVQKMLIQSCNMEGKPIVITRVVDTMVSSPRPTRAEATDIANAVLDGVDGILLGAETLRGLFPVEVVSTISGICRQAERVFDYQHHYEHLMELSLDAQLGGGGVDKAELIGLDSPHASSPMASAVDLYALGSIASEPMHCVPSMTRIASSLSQRTNYIGSSGTPLLSKLESLASSAVKAAEKVGAGMIVVYTNTGRTASLVAKYRPPMPIMTLVSPRLESNHLRWALTGRSTARQSQLIRGLLPMLATPGPSSEAVLEHAIAKAAKMGVVAPGSHVVCIQQVHEEFCVKVISVNKFGTGIKKYNVATGTEQDPAKLAAAAKAARLGYTLGAALSGQPGDDDTSFRGFVNTVSTILPAGASLDSMRRDLLASMQASV